MTYGLVDHVVFNEIVRLNLYFSRIQRYKLLLNS
jgi:hypothetical protein